jgi:hypothetical protein
MDSNDAKRLHSHNVRLQCDSKQQHNKDAVPVGWVVVPVGWDAVPVGRVVE